MISIWIKISLGARHVGADIKDDYKFYNIIVYRVIVLGGMFEQCYDVSQD